MTTLQRLFPGMSRILSRTGGLSPFSCSSRSLSEKIVKVDDIVLLKHRTNTSAPIITPKLRAGRKTALATQGRWADTIEHDHIIGKELRDIVASKKGVFYRILQPTLAEYTDNTMRIATPIYSQDASLIVSLLDLHPTPPRANAKYKEKLEIFEAGTGHGALTLHLARAIHAANPAAPMPEATLPSEDQDAQLEKHLNIDREWREARRAVIHTLDNSVAHSARAEQVVRNFRNGLYYPNVDFHTGTIEDYVSGRLVSTDEPFFDHAILDLPSTHSYFEILCKAIKAHGMLMGFCPSVTQISDCVLVVKQKKLPLFLEKVIELGGGIGVGGREWDVRLGTIRASGNKEAMVCRPKVGVRITGGGFLCVWRKINNPLSAEADAPIPQAEAAPLPQEVV